MKTRAFISIHAFFLVGLVLMTAPTIVTAGEGGGGEVSVGMAINPSDLPESSQR